MAMSVDLPMSIVPTNLYHYSFSNALLHVAVLLDLRINIKSSNFSMKRVRGWAGPILPQQPNCTLPKVDSKVIGRSPNLAILGSELV